MNKLIVILGPTSSGKSSLAIKLAKKFRGEIISADSRQVYKNLDIGTGKVSKQEQRLVPHHLLDVVSPKKQFTVADYKPLAMNAINKIAGKNKLPFLVGGTAFYIYAVVDDLQIPEVKPNLKLRNKLRNKTTAELFAILKKLDPKRAQTIDCHNPHRLIRAIEIVKITGHLVPKLSFPQKLESGNVLVLGIKKDPLDLKKLIHKRVEQRFKQGLIKEVKNLLRQGVTKKRLNEIGLTYRLVLEYLQNKKVLRNGQSAKSEDIDLIQKITNAEYKFSKRQMTWFKRDKRIHWVNNQEQAQTLIKKFLS